MRRLLMYVMLLFVTACAGTTEAEPRAPRPQSEWRGVWLTRFEWTDGTAQQIRARLSTAMADLATGNFNAVIFQVRGQGDTLYPSRLEPWSPRLSQDARRIDPVAHALAEARRNGLQFHAWFNLSTVWSSKEKRPPTEANHPFFRFADARHPQRRLGLIHDENGQPKQWGADDYVWLTPGNPEVNAYLRGVVVDFITRYHVDGIHWDDRTGNPHTPSRDPVSLRRFNGAGNPMKLTDFTAWQHDQLTRLLSDIYVAAKARQPSLLVSASPFGIADKHRVRGYSKYKDVGDFGTEPELWMRQGILDALMPQVYWDMPDPHPNYDVLVKDWMRHNKSGRPIWPGSALGKFGGLQPLYPVQKRYVDFTRSLGTGGNTFFSWSAAKGEQWRAAAKGIYPTKARVPVPAHMAKPTVGHVMGAVKLKSGAPVVDAWISVTGRSYVHLSSADGFYAIPNLPVGMHSVAVQHGAVRKTQKVTVKAGKVSVLNFGL